MKGPFYCQPNEAMLKLSFLPTGQFQLQLLGYANPVQAQASTPMDLAIWDLINYMKGVPYTLSIWNFAGVYPNQNQNERPKLSIVKSLEEGQGNDDGERIQSGSSTGAETPSKGIGVEPGTSS
jgi:hypothetical protein